MTEGGSLSPLFSVDCGVIDTTWLNPSVLSQELHIKTFRDHERMDRVGDSHGGVVIYVKENVCYRR